MCPTADTVPRGCFSAFVKARKVVNNLQTVVYHLIQ